VVILIYTNNVMEYEKQGISSFPPVPHLRIRFTFVIRGLKFSYTVHRF